MRGSVTATINKCNFIDEWSGCFLVGLSMECSSPPRLGSWPLASKKQKRDLEPVAQPELLQTAEGVIQRNSPLNYDLGVTGVVGAVSHPNRPSAYKDCMPWYASVGTSFLSQITPWEGWLSNSICVQSPYFVAACQHHESTGLQAGGNFAFAKSLIGCSGSADADGIDFNGVPGVFPGGTSWIEALSVDVDILTYPGSEDSNCSYFLVYVDEIDVAMYRESGTVGPNRDFGSSLIPMYEADSDGVVWHCHPPQCFCPYKVGTWTGNDIPDSQQPMYCTGAYRPRVVKEWHFGLKGSVETTGSVNGSSTFQGSLLQGLETITSNPADPQADAVVLNANLTSDAFVGHRIRERVELGLRCEVGPSYNNSSPGAPSVVPLFLNQKCGMLLLYFYSDVSLGTGVENTPRPIAELPRGCVHSNLYYRDLRDRK